MKLTEFAEFKQGEWAWLKFLDTKQLNLPDGYYQIGSKNTGYPDIAVYVTVFGVGVSAALGFKEYGKLWIAYKTQAEAEQNRDTFSAVITPSLICDRTYYAVCKIRFTETCPVCGGNYERSMSTEDGFVGTVKCTHCRNGLIEKSRYEIIPFHLSWALYNPEGDVCDCNVDVERDDWASAEDFICDALIAGPQPLEIDDDGDRACWTLNSRKRHLIFDTEQEAKDKIAELEAADAIAGGNQ